MLLPGGSDPSPVPVPLVLQARDHSFCHHSWKVVPNSENVIKLIGPLSLAQGHQLSSADMRLLHRGGKQCGENK